MKLVISDGIVFIRLNSVRRSLLERPHIAFELTRMVGIYVQKAPKTRNLGEKVSQKSFLWSKTGVYQDGFKKTLYLGRNRGKSVRILLLNPAFDQLLLAGRKSEKIANLLTPYLKESDFSQK